MESDGNDIINAADASYGTNYTKNVTVLSGGRTLIGPGHNSEIFTDDKGQEWIFYHAINISDYSMPNGATKRPLCIDKVTWTDGWPLIGNNGFPTEYKKEVPFFNE